EAAEKLRDDAVLEVALGDLVSPNNSYNKRHHKGDSSRVEVLVDDEFCEYSRGADLYLGAENRDANDSQPDPQGIPADLQADLERRNTGPAGSLSNFRPANPAIIVRDVDRDFKGMSGLAGWQAFEEKYPNALGYVRVSRLGYSRDGRSAIVVLEG